MAMATQRTEREIEKKKKKRKEKKVKRRELLSSEMTAAGAEAPYTINRIMSFRRENNFYDSPRVHRTVDRLSHGYNYGFMQNLLCDIACAIQGDEDGDGDGDDENDDEDVNSLHWRASLSPSLSDSIFFLAFCLFSASFCIIFCVVDRWLDGRSDTKTKMINNVRLAEPNRTGQRCIEKKKMRKEKKKK